MESDRIVVGERANTSRIVYYNGSNFDKCQWATQNYLMSKSWPVFLQVFGGPDGRVIEDDTEAYIQQFPVPDYEAFPEAQRAAKRREYEAKKAAYFPTENRALYSYIREMQTEATQSILIGVPLGDGKAAWAAMRTHGNVASTDACHTLLLSIINRVQGSSSRPARRQQHDNRNV